MLWVDADILTENVHINEHRKSLLEIYGKNLGFHQDAMDMLYSTLETLNTILERNHVEELARDWDRTGAQLKNGKVVLAPGFEKVVNEITVDNQLYNLFLPEDMGGLGFTHLMQGPISETIASYDVSLQIMLMISLTVMEPLIANPTPHFIDVLKEFGGGKHLGYAAFTEPNAGSNLEGIVSTSEKVGDEYVLNGTKIFISNGGYADIGLFLARNIVNGKAEGTNVFLVEKRDNIEILRLEEKSGLHASPTAQMQFDNVTVPADNLVGDVGKGYQRVLDRLMGMRIGVIFQGIGLAKQGYLKSKNYAENREQFGRAIIEFPQIRTKLQEMRQQIPRMEDYGYRASYSLDRYTKGLMPAGAGGEISATSTFPQRVNEGIARCYVSTAKVYTSEVCNQLLYDASQIFGGQGFVAETDVNRLMRDARVLSIYEGTSEIHSWIVSRSQQVMDLLPELKRHSVEYGGTTLYERILFERFPELKKLI